MSHHSFTPKPHFMVNSHNLLRQAASVLKVQLAKQAGRIVGKEESQLVLGFEKDDWGGWYAVIPTWPGPKAALAMVDGADTFLDMLSEGNDYVALHISVNPIDGYDELHYQIAHPWGDGAYYLSVAHDHRMWLCGVTEFVLGRMPDKIWYSVTHSAVPCFDGQASQSSAGNDSMSHQSSSNESAE